MATQFNPKAGLIPYMYENGILKMLFMVSSNPKFGGPKPMISKGTIEAGEDELVAAIREAEEELGLKKENLKEDPFLVQREYVQLRSSEYDLAIFAAEIKDKYDFNKWCYETAFATWMSVDSFMEKGRKDHKPIVQLLVNKLEGKQNESPVNSTA